MTDLVAAVRTASLEKLAEPLTNARRAFLLILAGFALAAALAGVLVVRRVLGPIGSLMRRM